MNNKLKTNAYTLMELLVVIAIISILGGLILTSVMRAMERTSRVSCANNLRQFGVAFKMYYQDYDSFPMAANNVNCGHRLFYTLDYITNAETYICPSDSDRSKGDPTNGNVKSDAQNNYDSYYSRLNPDFITGEAASGGEMIDGEIAVVANYYPSTGGNDGSQDVPFCPVHDIDSKRILMYDDPKAGSDEMHGDGRNYLFVDGTVTFWPFVKDCPDHDKLR